METCSVDEAGDRIGRLMGDIFTINAFVLGPMPIVAGAA